MRVARVLFQVRGRVLSRAEGGGCQQKNRLYRMKLLRLEVRG